MWHCASQVFSGSSLCQVALVAVFEARKQLIVQMKCTGRGPTSDLCCPRGCFCVCRTHHPGVCPPSALWDRLLQPARARLEFPVLRQRQHSELAIDASKSHWPPRLFIASYLTPWLLSHLLITACARVDSKSPRQRGGFKSGRQASICLSKVRLRCRMLSFSG